MRTRGAAVILVAELSVETVDEGDWVVRTACGLPSHALRAVGSANNHHIAHFALVLVAFARASCIALDAVSSARTAHSPSHAFGESSSVSWQAVSREAAVS